MGKGFRPDYYVQSIFNITAAEFRARGIHGLLLDIDNTLVPNHHPDADDRVITFVSKMQEAGIEMVILSNASMHRIHLFNRPLGLLVVDKGFKPFAKGYLKGIDLLGLPPAEICMVGDQLFTDIIGANKQGMKSMLVVPINPREPWYVKMKRLPEKVILARKSPTEHLRG